MVAFARILTALGVLTSALCVSELQADDHQVSHSWHVLPAMPRAVQEIYPALHQQRIVVAGGLTPDPAAQWIGVSDETWLFDEASKQWVSGPNLPEPRHHPLLASYAGGLYAFGGFITRDGGLWHNSVDVLLLPETGEEWQQVAQMPIPLAESLISVYQDRIHLATGRTPHTSKQNSQWRDQTDSNRHFAYSPETGKWQELPPTPTARNSACGVNVNGRWHTIGGRTVNGGNLAVHEVYDFAQQRWSVLPPLPQAQGGLACATVGQTIYVFGGEFFTEGGGVYSDVWAFDLHLQRWQQVSTMPVPRHGLGAVALDQRIYVVGGAAKAGGEETSNRLSVFTPAQD
ncbi:Kelch repeat-containing protein [Alteromonas flava]|uniref:Kelch repeat-containing protein n=1 Tax=Alteromonas flava TaxID=2048003 RepID=UPI000C28F6B8|nr:kelch repeat-containing protein [Alteromonas flava]